MYIISDLSSRAKLVGRVVNRNGAKIREGRSSGTSSVFRVGNPDVRSRKTDLAQHSIEGNWGGDTGFRPCSSVYSMFLMAAPYRACIRSRSSTGQTITRQKK